VKKINYLSLPKILFLPGGKLNKGDITSEWVEEGDGLTTQEEAKNRIIGARSWYWLAGTFILVLIGILYMIYLFLSAYQRRFIPKIEWEPASEVVVDFNRPAASRLLLGVFRVINHGSVPWFGKKLRNSGQPTRNALFRLSYNYLQDQGFKLSGEMPIGFVGNSKASGIEALSAQTQEVISHGKQIYLFLAADSLTDYRQQDVVASASGVDFQVPVSMQMQWQSREAVNGSVSIVDKLIDRLALDTSGVLQHDIKCDFSLKPEAEGKPLVQFIPSLEERIDFRLNEPLQIGTFHFISQAEHDYTCSFEWGDYTIKTYRDNLTLSGDPIYLETTRIVVPPNQTVPVAVFLRCDGNIVTNPDPVNHVYQFKLIGDFDARSDPGFHEVTLYRDRERAEIELTLTYPKPEREIFWTADQSASQRLITADNEIAQPVKIDFESLILDAVEVKFDSESVPMTLLNLKMGNSAKSGRGQVIVDITTKFDVDDDAVLGIETVGNRLMDDLLDVFDVDEVDSHAIIHEGEEPEIREVRIDTELITHIEGARTIPGQCRAKVSLEVHIETDQGEDIHRKLLVIIPLILEKLPGRNWLCIDFGTSAIAAALGTSETIDRIPLQEIKVPDGMSLQKYDPENSEVKSRYLLPSWVICDADTRKAFEIQARPGFPLYYPKDGKEKLSLTPGEPDFVGLPALSGQFLMHQNGDDVRDRIIYSLKSWLGKSASYIPLKTEVTYQEDGKLVKRDKLPLEKVMKSSLAALAEAYLLVSELYRADRFVLTHPNTFTSRHKEMFRRIAYEAFGKRFNIALEERIQLISESDAVAYYYCWEQMKTLSLSGPERILVYDFGAGTLDLSLVKVEWESDPNCYPRSWQVEGRIGVPVAGNYFDELLARLVDRLLSDENIIGTSEIEYQYKVVGKSYITNKVSAHSFAIIDLWRNIREAKHSWDGQSALEIRVGRLGGDTGIVKVGKSGNIKLLNTKSPVDEFGLPIAGLFTKDLSIYLSIPSEQVHGDEKISEFVEFVTETVIDELFHTSTVVPDSVNTVVISGRGAKWPKLRDRVLSRFPQETRDTSPNWLEGDKMKEAVVQGAIARQTLLMDSWQEQSPWLPKLGVLINNGHTLITEDQWDEPINLSTSDTFRIVQVHLKNPNPKKDKNSLREHFYVDVMGKSFRRDGMPGGAKQIYLTKEVQGDKLRIYVENLQRNNRISLSAPQYATGAVPSQPWPIGSPLLNPLKGR
jgi:hypothetical protein